MKCRLYPTTLLTILCCFLCLPSGKAAINTLEWRDRATQIARSKKLSDSLKVIRISDLSYNYFYYYRSFDERNLDEYLRMIEPFAQGDYSDDLLSYIYGTAVIVAHNSDVNKEMVNKCIHHTERCRTPLIAARSWEHLGRKYVSEAAGLGYLHKGLKVLENSPQEYAATSRIYRYIALYYSVQGDRKNETKYARSALNFALSSDNSREIMSAWESLAESYYYHEDYPSAIEAYNEAGRIYTVKLEPEEKDKDLRFRDALHYMVIEVNLGSMYSYNGQPDTAAVLMNKALDVARQTNMVETELYALKELGRIYLGLQQYQKAEEYLLEAQRLLTTDYVFTTESRYIACDNVLTLANLYSITGQYRKSTGYYQSGIEKYRALNDEEQLAANQEQAALYESQKQQQELSHRETIYTYRERQKYLYAGIIVVILLALFFSVKTYHTRIKLVRTKEKDLLDKTRMLEKEKRKIELDSELKQKEADALKEKLLYGNSLREQHNKTFESLNTFLAGYPELAEYQRQLKNIVLQQSRIDNNVDELKQGMNDVPLDFYIRLQKTAENKLSSLDLKYCRLLYLGTSANGMAAVLSVEPKTVRMQKYRLKQKLNLGKDDDLNLFIRKIADDKNDTV